MRCNRKRRLNYSLLRHNIHVYKYDNHKVHAHVFETYNRDDLNRVYQLRSNNVVCLYTCFNRVGDLRVVYTYVWYTYAML